MSTPELSDEILLQTQRALYNHGSQVRAAGALGISRSTIQNRLRIARDRGIFYKPEPPPDFETAQLPSGDMPTPQLIEHLRQRYEQRREAHDARNWIDVKVNVPGPIGIVHMGDPHLDDGGCAWPVLLSHVETIQKTEGLVASNLGDMANNWVGRLAALYGKQETSARNGWQLTEWLLKEVDFLFVVLGNHDLWTSQPINVIELVGRALGQIVEPHGVKVALNFPNGKVGKIHARHDFKGSSIHNDQHGAMRMAKAEGAAHLYISGHRHNWGCHWSELEHTGHVYWTARARGYKYIDDYAAQLGYGEQRHGASVVSIFDPDAPTETSFLHCFVDVEEAAEYLTWKRQRWAATQ